MSGVPGQGRKFDYDTALDRAMHVFWRHGYEGTSIAMLTKAMRIKAPSLYAAFGSKKDVFFAAVDRYNATHGAFTARVFAEESDSRNLIRRLLMEAAEAYAPEHCPGGCLIIASAVAVGSTNQHVAERLRDMRNANITLLSERLATDRDRGLIPHDTEPHAVAEFIGAVVQGMSQRARDGLGAKELRKIADTACRGLGFIPV
ncbi:TetR/AcrR family transcriptional regulator [Nocardia sp. NPDC051570]|uniref:TetR/AcrR family transcriptional regulator n=1 Tax=Nocardia sp. NPDC051570 TaxID=3364324 RepID=UPI00379D2FDE